MSGYKALIKHLLLFFLFLMVLFYADRAIFLVYNFSTISHEGVGKILQSFTTGLRLDISAACYLLIIPLVLALLELLTQFKWLSTVRKIYALVFVIAFWLMAFVQLPVFADWGIKMHYKALAMFIKNTSDALDVATPLIVIPSVILVTIFCALSYWLYVKKVHAHLYDKEGKIIWAPFSLIGFAGLLFIGIRGGLYEIPLQLSAATYNNNNTLNNAAANSVWHIANSILYNVKYTTTNPYRFMADEDADKVVQELYAVKPDTTLKIFTTNRPNVVVFILESWSATVMSCITGNEATNATPNLNKLAQEGVLFTRCYASGERSDQGVAAVLAGYPALPTSAISNIPEKLKGLPGLPLTLHNNGYSSLFLYGGQVEYGNIQSLLYQQQIQKVITENDFGNKYYKGRLGVHDENTLPLLIEEAGKLKEPFFASLFNISTHFHYDYPKPKREIAWAGKFSDYVNSIEYADSCFGVFINDAKKQPWFKNTVFIFLSDHSANSPGNEDFKSKEHHHIPLIIYGDCIRPEYRGLRINKTVSQQDMCATILSQLGMDVSGLLFSKDALNPSAPPFAYYTFTEGLGWVESDSCWYMEDAMMKYHINTTSNCDTGNLQYKGRAYLQSLYNNYLGR
jgi:phosphoglycerol transferase MdoB-like AlkP superfamily enzyme